MVEEERTRRVGGVSLLAKSNLCQEILKVNYYFRVFSAQKTQKFFQKQPEYFFPTTNNRFSACCVVLLSLF